MRGGNTEDIRGDGALQQEELLSQALVWWDAAADMVRQRLQDRDAAMVADYERRTKKVAFDLVPGQ